MRKRVSMAAVFQAMSQKAAIRDDDFKQYLEVLLGNKDDKKVMELMSKAEKAMRNSKPNRRCSGRRCFSCGGYGQFQATCPFGRRYEWSPPSRHPNPSPYRSAELVAVRLPGVCRK